MRDKLFMIAMLGLAILLWLLFPQKRLPSMAGSNIGFTADDIVKHTTLSDEVVISRPQLDCCDVGGTTVWLEKPSSDSILRPNVEIYATSLTIEVAHETSAFVALSLNNKYAKFALDGREGILHELELAPGCSYSIPIALEMSQPGNHRVEVRIYTEPEGLIHKLAHRLFGNFQVAGAGRQFEVGMAQSGSESKTRQL